MLTRFVLSIGLVISILGPAASKEKDQRPAAALQDNSFLIEEPYNQEPGMLQHTGVLRWQGHDWTLNFSQEWPVGSQTHQFSYAVPYA